MPTFSQDRFFHIPLNCPLRAQDGVGVRGQVMATTDPHICCFSFFTFAEKPDAPIFNNSEIERRSASFTWQPTFEGNRPIVSYTIEYRKVDNATGLGNLTGDSVLFGNETFENISGLRPFTNYSFSLTATNDQGESEPATVLVRTLQDSKRNLMSFVHETACLLQSQNIQTRYLIGR